MAGGAVPDPPATGPQAETPSDEGAGGLQTQNHPRERTGSMSKVPEPPRRPKPRNPRPFSIGIGWYGRRPFRAEATR